MTEPELLIPFNTDYGTHVEGLVMSGDPKQSGPVVLGGRDKNNTTNEFRTQLKLSPMHRFLALGYTAVKFNQQWRMHRAIFEPSNLFHYGGEVYTHDSLNTPIPAEYSDLMAKMCRISDKSASDMNDTQRRLGWARPLEGVSRKSTVSQSLANVEYAKFVISCVRHLMEALGANVSSKCAIITPYRRQAQLYQELFSKLLREELWKHEELPAVVTIDSAQGKEWDIVLQDIVNV